MTVGKSEATSERTDTPKTVSYPYVGGCKSYPDYVNPPRLMCKKNCAFSKIGRDRVNRFRWVMDTPTSFVALNTVNNKRTGFPAKSDPYVGMFRLDEKFCGAELLEEIEKRGCFLIDIGDKTPNYELQSITYPRGFGEKDSKLGFGIFALELSALN